MDRRCWKPMMMSYGYVLAALACPFKVLLRECRMSSTHLYLITIPILIPSVVENKRRHRTLASQDFLSEAVKVCHVITIKGSESTGQDYIV